MNDDVKIYVSQKEKQSLDSSFAPDIETMNLHRANGNLVKANELGKKLAGLTTQKGGEGLFVDFNEKLAPKFFSPEILFQIRVLMIFTAEALLQLNIPVLQISTTAVNAMHSALRKTSPAFYKNISDGAAFTFYYLAMKKGGSLCDDIGEAFAMLCSVSKNKEGFINAGKTVWSIVSKLVGDEIEKAGFELYSTDINP